MELQNALTQTLYSQLLDEALAYAVTVSEQGVVGSPYVNKSGGHQYLYWQVRQPDGSFRRTSLGRDSPGTQAVVDRLLARKRSATEAIEALKTTARAFVASGGSAIEPTHFKVLETLARGGLLTKGVVLVGSHAFAALGNSLGIRWGGPLRTTDVDFARGEGIALAIPDTGHRVDVPAAVKASDASFFEMPRLDFRQPSTSIASHKTKVTLDFLTVQKSARDTAPRYFADLSIAALPLPYMDYLLGGDCRSGLVVGNYAIPVNLPDPARFAIHKLVIAQERAPAFIAKSEKDLRQATELTAALIELGREDEIVRAIGALHGTRARRHLEKSVGRIAGPTGTFLRHISTP